MAIECTQCARHSIVANIVEPGEQTFKSKVLKWLETAILMLIFANTVNTSFHYTCFQLRYKHYVAFTF